MRRFAGCAAATLLLCGSLALGGCGGGSPSMSCNGYGFLLRVAPVSTTADSASAPPGNQVQFVGTAVATAPSGCPVPALARLEYAAWANPDPADIQISSANDSTNGTAVCKAPSDGAVTLTGVFAPVTVSGPAGSGSDQETETVSLTCK